MTAQASEILIYEGKTLGMACEPFSQYLIKYNLELRLRAPNTALWRGYRRGFEIGFQVHTWLKSCIFRK